jgi:hypothetical protein
VTHLGASETLDVKRVHVNGGKIHRGEIHLAQIEEGHVHVFR